MSARSIVAIAVSGTLLFGGGCESIVGIHDVDLAQDASSDSTIVDASDATYDAYDAYDAHDADDVFDAHADESAADATKTFCDGLPKTAHFCDDFDGNGGAVDTKLWLYSKAVSEKPPSLSTAADTPAPVSAPYALDVDLLSTSSHAERWISTDIPYRAATGATVVHFKMYFAPALSGVYGLVGVSVHDATSPSDDTLDAAFELLHDTTVSASAADLVSNDYGPGSVHSTTSLSAPMNYRVWMDVVLAVDFVAGTIDVTIDGTTKTHLTGEKLLPSKPYAGFSLRLGAVIDNPGNTVLRFDDVWVE